MFATTFRHTQAQSLSEREIERQVAWEIQAVRKGEKRYREEQLARDPADRSAAQALITQAVAKLAPKIAEYQGAIKSRVTGRGRPADWWIYLGLLTPEKLAYLTLRAIFSAKPDRAVVGRTKALMVSLWLVSAIRAEVDYQDWKVEDRAKVKEARSLGKAFRSLVAALNVQDLTRWRRVRSRIECAWRETWPLEQRTHLGISLIRWAADVLPEWVAVDTIPIKGGKTERYIRLTEAAHTLMQEHDARKELMRPLNRPMLCSPKPWQWDGEYTGGYYLVESTLFRCWLNKHTAGLERPISDETLAAINAVQATPWRINTAILETMRAAWVSGMSIAGMPKPDEEMLPPRVLDAIWKAMPTEERAKRKADLAEIHGRNARAKSKRYSWLYRMDIATDVAEEPSIWFPHFVDFRGRIYPMASELNPQGDEATKALLMFAEGKPLGEDGMAWLCIRAANCWGHDLDKLALAERVEWALQREAWFKSIAADPLMEGGAGEELEWFDWTQAEEPWSFLATCFELAEAFEQGPNFVSHLPIPLDGSCNGLQHLAAMGRDRLGAEATNVLPNPARRDIYSEVAKLVNEKVVADAGQGNPQAVMWLGKVTRKVVKRAVMTTPYGVTDRGVRDQLIADRHTEALDGDIADRGRAADYMRDCIQAALSEAVSGAKSVMGWLQALAEALAEAELPLRWETPTGNTIQQSYWEVTKKLIRTLAGEVALHVETREAGMRKKKQSQAAAPNVVHSFDAAHLCKTVNACLAAGVASFAMIHDSFGTHAADTPVMAYVLRAEFARIYQDNWLQRIEDYVRGYAGSVEIPGWRDFVTLGDLEVSEVLQAEFFFA